MLTVLFDTNILHQEGLNSTRIQRFQRFLKASDGKLIIPEIVIEEYRSKRIFLAEKEISKIKKSLDLLQRKDFLKDDNYKNTFLSYQLHQTFEECIKKISIKIDTWVKENNVEIYKISNTCIDSLFKNYFSGHGGFREKKKREDIPDAIIYDAIVNIAKDKKLYVVINDVGLQKAIDSIPNVEWVTSLDDFLNIENIKETIIKLDEKNFKISNILKYLNSTECSINFDSYFSNIDININNPEYTFYSDLICFSDAFEDIEITNPELEPIKTKEQYFDLSGPNYLGNNNFSVSFSTMEKKASVKFNCQEEDFEKLPYGIRKLLNTNKIKSTNVLHVSGILDVDYCGVITISNIDENLKPEELNIHFSYIGAEQSEISCKLDIESVLIRGAYGL
ncbi:MAG: DUF4935 domain-containing protein [Desulfobacteraceae bacterium]|nr:DUF4935 domain-containing protein [Desulfobacteraceae bacterium]